MTQEKKKLKDAAHYYAKRVHSDNENLLVIDLINFVTSEAAKEYHAKGMYSENDVKLIIAEYFKNIVDNMIGSIHAKPINIDQWFEQNKKK